MGLPKGVATEVVKHMIAYGQPNQNLIQKANKKFDVDQQLAREAMFYEKIRMKDPNTGAPITTIQQLNAVIQWLDSQYGFGALLPSDFQPDSILGQVELELSKKYDLTKISESSKFTEKEQLRIQEFLNKSAQKTFEGLKTDPEFLNLLQTKSNAEVARLFMAAMSATRLDLGNGVQATINFMSQRQIIERDSGGKGKTLTSNKKIGIKDFYERLLSGGGNIFTLQRRIITLKDDTTRELSLSSFYESVMGSGRRTKANSGFIRISRVGGDSNGIGGKIENIQLEFNDFDSIPKKLYWQLRDVAREAGFLENAEAFTGKKSLKETRREEWTQDVYDAVYNVIYNVAKDKSAVDKSMLIGLMQKYGVAEKIALYRDPNSLRGFLGELRAILIVDKLFTNTSGRTKKGVKLNLTGRVKEQLQYADSLGDSPLDLIVSLGKQYGFGIQVKNTQKSSFAWTQNSKDGMLLPNFYAERLQEALGSNEAAFFAHWIYNAPREPANPIYAGIYEGFQTKIDKVFIPVYKQLTMYIIRQLATLKGGDILRNDFFMLGQKLIPTSAFYKYLGDPEYFKSEFDLINTHPEGYYHSSQKLPPPGTYLEYAKQVKVKYEIEVFYNKILESAYSSS